MAGIFSNFLLGILKRTVDSFQKPTKAPLLFAITWKHSFSGPMAPSESSLWSPRA